jgi:hypothetical protein
VHFERTAMATLRPSPHISSTEGHCRVSHRRGRFAGGARQLTFFVTLTGMEFSASYKMLRKAGYHSLCSFSLPILTPRQQGAIRAIPARASHACVAPGPVRHTNLPP